MVWDGEERRRYRLERPTRAQVQDPDWLREKFGVTDERLDYMSRITQREIPVVFAEIRSQFEAIAQEQAVAAGHRESTDAKLDDLAMKLAPIVESVQDAAEAGRLAKKYGPRFKRAALWVAALSATTGAAWAWVQGHWHDLISLLAGKH